MQRMKNLINLLGMTYGKSIGNNNIGTKWIFKNKTNEFGNIVRNKTKLVARNFTQVEGIDFDEIFALNLLD